MAPSNMAFQKDEKVLCFHQELLYEANILDVQLEDPKDKKGPYKYKVHYRGWKKTWDGWVPQDRLRKWSEENHELAKTLKKEMDALNQQRNKSSASTKKRGDVSARDSEERNVAGRKRGRDYDTEKEEAFQSKPAVRIIMPDALKSILVDDWENITKNLQLAAVPAKEYTVSKVMSDYYETEKINRGEHSAAANILEEVVSGLIEYFNKSLGRLLLYRFERGQYEDILARVNKSGDDLEGKPLAEIYGCEHLLRLFVALPELIAQTNMDQQSATRLREELHGLTTWLSKDKNIKKYLATPYENQGTDYQERMEVISKTFWRPISTEPFRRGLDQIVGRISSSAIVSSPSSKGINSSPAPTRDLVETRSLSHANKAKPVRYNQDRSKEADRANSSLGNIKTNSKSAVPSKADNRGKRANESTATDKPIVTKSKSTVNSTIGNRNLTRPTTALKSRSPLRGGKASSTVSRQGTGPGMEGAGEARHLRRKLAE